MPFASAQSRDGDPFETVLRGLGLTAFRAVVDHGVRDLRAFLNLDPTVLRGVSHRVVAEIRSAQQASRAHLKPVTQDTAAQVSSQEHACSVVGKIDAAISSQAETLQPDGQLARLDRTLRSLSGRARRCLAKDQVQTVADLMRLEECDLQQFPGVGRKTVQELLQAKAVINDIVIQNADLGQLLLRQDMCARLGMRARPDSRFDVRKPEAVEPFLCRQKQLREHVRQTDQAWEGPADWSVLQKTVPDLLMLEDEALDRLWSAASGRSLSTLGLHIGEWQALSAAGIYAEDQFDVLLGVTLGYLVESSIDSEAFDVILGSVTALAEGNKCSNRRPDDVALARPIVSDSEVASIRRFRIDSFDVPQHILESLHSLGVQTWGDLTALTESAAVASGLSLDALRRIRDLWQAGFYARQATALVSGLPAERLMSFESMMQAFMGPVTKTVRDETILAGRMGLLEERRWTLDDLGSLLGVTRERVRQIEHKALRALRKPHKMAELAKFWVAVDESLRIAGRVCSFREMAESVAARMEWSQLPRDEALISILRLSEHVTVRRAAGLVCDQQRRPCIDCEAVVSALEALLVDDQSERPLTDVLECLRSTCTGTDGCSALSASSVFSEGFLRFVASKTNSVLVEDGLVSCRDTRDSRRGLRMQLVESILRGASEPMHFMQVCEAAREILPDDIRVTGHNVRSWLERSANVLLWDRGTYVHRDRVRLPTRLVEDITRWLMAKLRSGVPFVSVMVSSTNPREFVQRRGRILRLAEGKSEAAVYDFIVVPPSQGLALQKDADVSILKREMPRFVVPRAA